MRRAVCFGVYDGERYWPAVTLGLPPALAAYLGDSENVFISPYLLGITEGDTYFTM